MPIRQNRVCRRKKEDCRKYMIKTKCVIEKNVRKYKPLWTFWLLFYKLNFKNLKERYMDQ